MTTNQKVEEARVLHTVPSDLLPNYRRVWNQAEAGSYTEGLGRLVIVTSEMVAAAAIQCIRSGQRTTLAWDMSQLNIANFDRQPAQHHIVGLLGRLGFDDVYVFNPQLRHSEMDRVSERMAYATTKTHNMPGSKALWKCCAVSGTRGFAVVGGDSLACEVYPAKKEYV
ncbi:hypothetical protein ACJQWK_10158 [Exserohilum turcicum]|uniref:Uncharacterized protein n=1 Tax=Exserohilum turcicum (strain 28A) TaxID=671987 RepID=R0IQI7_EXST2|nr:uncharacterized protein SETTUDRAFT_19682 [Exserohilum turcica Et28A]EOA87150.1 hypothetical protein SETTUDRAFT_19682 [Exserohilum turcica Et28A]